MTFFRLRAARFDDGTRRAQPFAPENMDSTVAVLDPLERTTEVLFGVIMVLTFTSSISVVEGGQAETREILVAALGCNIAWGIVDGAFYLMASFVQRARGVRMLRAIRESPDQTVTHGLILTALPSPVSAVMTPSEVEGLRQRLRGGWGPE